MLKRVVMLLAIAVMLASTAWAQAKAPKKAAAPLSPEAAALELKLEEAKAKVVEAQDAVADLEMQLANANTTAMNDLIARARGGEEAAIRQIVDMANARAVWTSYDYAKIVKGVDVKPFLAVLDQVWPDAEPAPKAKFCWMLGVNGSAEAAARLRAVLENETDATILGNAIYALGRCADSPENLASVKRHTENAQEIKDYFGFYPYGVYQRGGGTPLGLAAKQYVAKRDPANAATVPGEVIVEPATIHCAGFQWKIQGDSNRNCAVTVAYRKVGTEAWKPGFPFWRCETWPVPEGAKFSYRFDEVGEMLAGSIFDLEPVTEYEVKLTLKDPDGGEAEQVVRTKTIKEPEIYAGERILYVVPPPAPEKPGKPTGGGTGTKEDPFQGIGIAAASAQPGDVFLLQPGKYLGEVMIRKSGEEGKPIVFRGVDVDKVILDGTDVPQCLSFSGQSFLHFENLSFTKAKDGCIKTYGSQDIVVRRCKFFGLLGIGIIAGGGGGVRDKETREVSGARNSKNWFILDNEITNRKPWGKARGDAMWTGVALSGERNIIAYNTIRDCWDCISLGGSRGLLPLDSSTDVYGNDLYQGADDGVEADYTFHNVRIFRNRLTNTFSSLSAQPTFGGPTYFLYNAMYNTTNKPFKLHVHSTGVIVAHNTSAVSREAFMGGTFHKTLFRNNLLIGLPGEKGCWLSTDGYPMDMDYGGYNIANASRPLMDLNGIRYKTMADFTEDTGMMKHGVLLDWNVFNNPTPPPGDDKFADVKTVDITLRAGSKAIDAGEVMPGINDDFAGAAPDLGCYEVGKPMPHYGVRPVEQAK